MSPYWSPHLDSLSSEQETVAQFRERLNILDEAPQFTPFSGDKSEVDPASFLTDYERHVEEGFTPHFFKYFEEFHGPPSTVTGIVKNYAGVELSIFHPSVYDDYCVYALDEDPDEEIFVDIVILNHTYYLGNLDKYWGYLLDQLIPRQIHSARLTQPTHNDVFLLL